MMRRWHFVSLVSLFLVGAIGCEQGEVQPEPTQSRAAALLAVTDRDMHAQLVSYSDDSLRAPAAIDLEISCPAVDETPPVAEREADTCDPGLPRIASLTDDRDASQSMVVESCGPACAGFPIPPVERWDPDVSMCRSCPGRALPYDPMVCSPANPAFLAFKARKCPDDLPKDQVWLYDACLALSTLDALGKAAKVMPPPIDKFAKAAGAGGKKACCDAVFDTEVPPTWECTMKELAKDPKKAKATYLSCKNCCDTKWPVVGTTNAVQNSACTKSCTRGKDANNWAES